MVNTDEARGMASDLVAAYINYCLCQNNEHVKEALTVLLSIAGLTMAAAIGQEQAVHSLEHVAGYVASTGDTVQLGMTTTTAH